MRSRIFTWEPTLKKKKKDLFYDFHLLPSPLIHLIQNVLIKIYMEVCITQNKFKYVEFMIYEKLRFEEVHELLLTILVCHILKFEPMRVYKFLQPPISPFCLHNLIKYFGNIC